jgi:hypothetical protein
VLLRLRDLLGQYGRARRAERTRPA